ncbi:hypothetical protein PROFUN_08126 [Planoprotostelium fungivorum]|uniref:N-acetyltransferase domain-containing protein n=1 Tax=Planoprotostelium fungivorum TaxID=1890364 RepID=A0A2P6MQF7_9EUKA|nr:hypothetical protein PROFUN_08126 [Planoprotostelium fungivorum]
MEDERYKFAPIILDRYQKKRPPVADNRKKRSFSATLRYDEEPKKERTSPYTYRLLKPYIWRTFSSRPAKLRLMDEIYKLIEDPIDYCYLSYEHLEQINRLLRDTFWPGIDVSEFLEYPDFTIVALYKKMVLGCAFMTPQGYITYVSVHPEWQSAGIASFMLYHLVQTIPNADITLHVSTTNTAMILYQKFGFKPEEFIIDFYHKYYPDERTDICKHAFFMRMRR